MVKRTNSCVCTKEREARLTAPSCNPRLPFPLSAVTFVTYLGQLYCTVGRVCGSRASVAARSKTLPTSLPFRCCLPFCPNSCAHKRTLCDQIMTARHGAIFAQSKSKTLDVTQIVGCGPDPLLESLISCCDLRVLSDFMNVDSSSLHFFSQTPFLK